ncbi:hypothetical protein QYE76_070368 [Lolium multiflorum]|uniref:DDE Tnp4 domain-containing protein n=1 Tax=Lolium multiflorum TaxID=4521 RepID=A0AAD8WDV0_LOLMU|nr:hypothetical protein QYE76_070368 [Lolium multiflorum]
MLAKMGCAISRLVKATIALVIIAMLFMLAAMADTVASFNATRSQRIPLPDGSVRGPESVAFDGQGQSPYSGVSNGRVLKWLDNLHLQSELQHRSMQVDHRSMRCRPQPSFRGRKHYTFQNVLAVVDFDMRFTYVLAGWDGSAHDASILSDSFVKSRWVANP